MSKKVSIHKSKARELKTAPVFVIDYDEAKGIVEAVVSVMGIVDDGDDIIENGSYTKTIAERMSRIRVLDSHNYDSVLRVVGHPLEIREIDRDELPDEVLEKYPDATGGLYTKTQYYLDTPEGEGVFKRIVKGGVGEYSIGFDIVQKSFEKREGKRVRIIKEIRLWEYSAVIWGMNPATATVGVKGYGADGAQRTIGDVLLGVVHGSMINFAVLMLKDGYLSGDEYAEIFDSANNIMDVLRGDISSSVWERPIGEARNWDYWYLSGPGAGEAKQESHEPEAADAEPPLVVDDEVESVGSDSEDETPPTPDDAASIAEAINELKAMGEQIEQLTNQ